jgi:membrane protein
VNLEHFKKAFTKWQKDRGARTAAALAFFTVLSLSPLLLLALSVVGLVYSGQEARTQLLERIQTDIGPAAVQVVQPIIENAARPGSGIMGSILGTLLVLFSASALFAQWDQSINDLWEVPDPESTGIIGFIRAKIYHMVIALVAAALFLASMSVSVASAFARQYLPMPPVLFSVLEYSLSFLMLSAVIALMFKELPRTTIEWSDVLKPAAVTSVLFLVGKAGLNFYFGFTAAGSSYGAAGSLVILLMWLFYTGQIMLLGASYSYVYAHEAGSLKGQGVKAVDLPTIA